MDLVKFKAQLILHEGLHSILYDDKTGKLPMLALPTTPVLMSPGRITGGIGHNFSSRPLSPAVIDLLFSEDVAIVVTALNKKLSWWAGKSDVRQRVLADMTFNLGIGGVLTFPHMLSAMQLQQDTLAASLMMQSEWAKQVGQRAVRLSEMWRTDTDYTIH